MSKFKKVAETQGIPEYLEKQFMPQINEDEDIYKELRQAARKHRQVIARETIGNNLVTHKENKWEKISSAETYRTPRMNPIDEKLSNLDIFDTSARAIRRAGYDVDEGDNTRPGVYGDIQFGDAEEVMSAAIRGTTIFDPYKEEIEDRLLQSQAKESAKMLTAEIREKQIATRKAEWEQEKLNELKPFRNASSRANPILRTGIENVSAGAFGLPNYRAAEERENTRKEMLDEKRKQKLAISRVGRSEDYDWTGEAELKAQTFQEYQSQWLNTFGVK